MRTKIFVSTIAMLLSFAPVAAQTLGDGVTVTGHLVTSNPPAAPPPTGTNCTMVAGSTDVAGECAATATSAVAVAFGKPFLTRPMCVITDSVTATGINLAAGPSTTGFTLGTTAAADKIRWICTGQVGN